MWENLLQNREAIRVAHEEKPTRPDFPKATADIMRDLCVVLAPLRTSTKSLEGDGLKASASLYLPVWADVLDDYKLEAKTMPIPLNLRSATDRSSIPVSSLCELAQECRIWIQNDLRCVMNKHLVGSVGIFF